MKFKTGFMSLDEVADFDLNGCFVWHDCNGRFVYVLTECLDHHGDTLILPGKLYLLDKKIFLPDKLFLEGDFKPKSWKPIGWCYTINP